MFSFLCPKFRKIWTHDCTESRYLQPDIQSSKSEVSWQVQLRDALLLYSGIVLHRAQCMLGFFLDVQEGNTSCRTMKHKQKRQALHCQVGHHLNCDLISPSIGRRQRIPMIPVHSHHNLGKLKWFNMQNVLRFRERHWRSILLYSKYYLRNSKQKISLQQSQNSKTKECSHQKLHPLLKSCRL